MKTLARIINGFCSVVGLLIGVASFLLSGIASSVFPDMASLAFLVSIFPFVIFLLSAIGLYGVIKNNVKAQMAFDICLLPAWYVGTVVGGICLLLLLLNNKVGNGNLNIEPEGREQ